MAATRASTYLWRSSLRQYLSGRPLHEIARRTFANTAQHNRNLPSFEPSSSKELDALLSLIRERILITGSLNPRQQELVFHPKWRATLENEPVYATVGGEEIQLQPYDRFNDVPNRWRSFRQALQMAETDEDWRNMVRMLEGYQSITKGKHMGSDPVQMFVRRAKQHNQIDQIWRCLWNVNATGMSLRDPGIAHAVLIGCVSERLRSQGHNKSAVEDAWARVKKLLQVMEMPEHCGGAFVKDDMRQQPWVLGVVVEVVALHQKLQWPGGDGMKDEVQTYVARLLDCVGRKPLNVSIDWVIWRPRN